MAGDTVRPIREMETMAHGALRRAVITLGLESFGMQAPDPTAARAEDAR